MATLILTENKLLGEYTNERGGVTTTDLSSMLSLGGGLALTIAEQWERYSKRYSTPAWAKNLRRILCELGIFAADKALDTSNGLDVYNFMFAFRAHWYTTGNILQSLLSRNGNWMSFKQFLEHLIDVKVLPEFYILPGNPKLEYRQILRTPQNSLLGESHKEEVLEEKFISKALVPISLARSDDAYLEEYPSVLQEALDTFSEAADKELEEIKHDIKIGQGILDSIDYKVLKKKVEESFRAGKPYLEFIDGLVQTYACPCHL